MPKLSFVLIVDDDETSNYLTELFLEEFGICDKMRTLLNGQQAVQFFLENNDEYPELVLLDINMPLMNGFEFLEWWEKNNRQGKTKFAMLTTSIRREDQKQARKYKDVIGYIEKPIVKQKIIELIEDKFK